MKFKNINKLLSIGILLNGFNVSSFAGTLSSDTRYETFEGFDIDIYDILEEDIIDIEINGNTALNLLGNQGLSTFAHNNTDWRRKRSFYNVELKPYTTYTLFTKISNISSLDSSPLKVHYSISNSDGSTSEVFPDNYTTYENVSNGYKKIVFTTRDMSLHTKSLYLYVDIKGSNYGAENEFSFDSSECILLEGDYSGYNIEYFEGIKSAGEDNVNGHKIKLLLNNKNLFPYTDSTIPAKSELTWYDINGKRGLYGGTAVEHKTDTWIHLKEGYYKIKGDFFNCGYQIIDNNEFIYDFTGGTLIPEGMYCLRLKNYNTTDAFGYKNAAIYRSEKPVIHNNDYISHQVNSLEIALNEPLRSLPNGVKDRIIKKDGRWTVERNIGEIILDGSENWMNYVDTTVGYDGQIGSVVWASLLVDNLYVNHNENTVLCDKFTSVKGNDYSYYNEMIYTWDRALFDTTEPCIYIHMDSSKFTTKNLESYKKWLSQNPVTVVYQLATPTYETLNIDSTINLYLDTTHISNSSHIPASLKTTVDRTLNRAVKATTLAQTNSSIENISHARYWNNLLKESISKDYLQNIINSIGVENILGEMEFNKMSSNSDIYIKGKNTLSLSLDTNTIVFEDFDGTEDMELLKAVNLTVSSSLPYDIKSTLDTDISNSDKSIVLNPMILNIKSSGTNNYQTFTSTGDELLLLSNETSGTNKLHSLDVMLDGGFVSEADVYKTVIKLEVIQK